MIVVEKRIMLIDMLGGTALIEVIPSSGRVLDCLRQTGKG